MALCGPGSQAEGVNDECVSDSCIGRRAGDSSICFIYVICHVAERIYGFRMEVHRKTIDSYGCDYPVDYCTSRRGILMDYSKLSDFEINKRVLALKSEIKPLAYPHNADERSAGIVDINGGYHWFDFCNNPADAWPIIQNNGISLTYDGFDWMAECIMGNASKYSCDIDQHPNRPLRAAMIVYLMMQESE